jgi:hypothetical protein
MHKVDFEAAAASDTPFKVGQHLQLTRQHDGSWTCSLPDDSRVLCTVPSAAAAVLAQQQQQEAAPAAVVRTIKRSPDNPDAAVSIQVRISFNTQGTASSTALATEFSWSRHLLVDTAGLLSAAAADIKPVCLANLCTVAPAGTAPALQQAPAPQDDPTGFCLTTNELQQLGG